MCNCGCDTSTNDQANSLRKQAGISGAGAACLAGIPAAINSAQHPHPAVMWTTIGIQVILIARAGWFLRKRKHLLQGV